MKIYPTHDVTHPSRISKVIKTKVTSTALSLKAMIAQIEIILKSGTIVTINFTAVITEAIIMAINMITATLTIIRIVIIIKKIQYQKRKTMPGIEADNQSALSFLESLKPTGWLFVNCYEFETYDLKIHITYKQYNFGILTIDVKVWMEDKNNKSTV